MAGKARVKRKTKATTSRGRGQNKTKKPLNWSAVSTYIVVFSVFFFILAVGICKIYLNNQTDELRDKISRITNDELKMIEKERQNLLTEKASLMKASEITTRARQIGLEVPISGVVRKMRQPSTKKLNEYILENKE